MPTLKRSAITSAIIFFTLTSSHFTYAQFDCTCQSGLPKAEKINCIRILGELIRFEEKLYYSKSNTNQYNDNKVQYEQYLDSIHTIGFTEPNGEVHYEEDFEDHIENLKCLLQLEDASIQADTLQYFLDFVTFPVVALELYEHFADVNEMFPREDTYKSGLARNSLILQKHLNYLISNNYVQYNYPTAEHKLVKGLFISSPNDVFFPFKNQDRNFTGGLRVELSTDFLRLRFKPVLELHEYFKERDKKFMAGLTNLFSTDNRFFDYQSLLWGFEIYTPDLRNGGIFTDPFSYDTLDRPYASFQWFGLGKNKVDSKGAWRTKSELKIGLIGGNTGKAFQTMIHQDLTIASRRPFGWEAQVANGGRVGIQWDYEWDPMIISKGSTIFRQQKNSAKTNEYFNVFVPIQLHVGAQLTGADIGLGYTATNFKELSAHNDVLDRRGKIAWNFMMSFNYRYQHHNTMLEGFGYFKTSPDEEFLGEVSTSCDPIPWQDIDTELVDRSGQDIYVLCEDHVKRHLFIANAMLTIRSGNTVFSYQYSGISREFDFEGAKSKNWHQWGTVSISYLF